jgi:peptidoglycan-N-acetylglucosamine deacetylase
MLKFNILSVLYILLLILCILFVEGFYLILVSLIVLTTLYISIIAWGVSNIQSQMFVKSYNSNPKVPNKVALTFDDGPHEVNTPKIIKILKEYEAKASFFLIGENIAKFGQLAKNIYAEGHLIGNHTYYHSNTFPFKLPGQIKLELLKTQQEIEKITGRQNKFFRPPFGVTNHFIAKAISNLGLKVIGWNIRSYDTTNKQKEQILKRIIKNLKGGDIILLHDKTKDICWLTVEILKYLKQNKLKTVTIEELLFNN